MKKFTAGLILAAGTLAMSACGTGGSDNASGSDKENKELVVGASNTPHAIILEEAKPLLEEKGIDLKIETYQDYVLPNEDLDSGEIDANYFQHIPYLETQMKDHDYDFEIGGEIHIEPIGVYSKKYKSLDELPEGATILISNSVADHGRVLAMLETEGLIKLDEKVDKTEAEVKDITDNPKNLQFDANYEASFLPTLYNQDEGDALLINSNYAIDNGLNPLEDAIALEESDSPYVNIIAVRKGDKDREDIKALVEVLHSQEIKDFILDEWGGSVVPVD
ncbi:MetQ/NlpA family ABC transporter substrate-binding protein [Bhargavaea cecembensis]|uniref:MetQ/NlpA family ABC transporter substrate-binding protein n=1 Tax=Bhargavaea cecembensis TaxID=394098 RepID=UPI00058F9288|nr:MetQ/NlpA family ABC transporter substrate-binding protein [Bhargavaea cecembensis]